MGSYCALKFDDVDVISFKSGVPDVLISMFQEADRIVRANDQSEDGEEYLTYMYCADRPTVLTRLDVMGFTAAGAEQAFSRWLASERASYAEYTADGSDWAEPSQQALNTFSYEEWQARVFQSLSTRFDIDRDESGLDFIARHMSALDGSWLFFEADDDRLMLRALLEACPQVVTVTLDISDLVHGGWIGPDELICQQRREPSALARPVLDTAVIMAEGSSDIRALRLSLAALYPELQEYFSFFEHNELSVDGGASYLVKFLKAFAGARISTRIIAIFDNDTEGLRHYNAARGLGLPKNISVLRLPDVEIARAYLTDGPQGQHAIDVNGLACGIEMYFGRKVLTRETGDLTPVRWTAYIRDRGAYQGELENKTALANTFEEMVRSHPTPAQAQACHPEMVAVWQSIFACCQAFRTIDREGRV
ncbi:HEPN/Toprim-associated domain-containing protein [Methylobacterium sp. A52T]